SSSEFQPSSKTCRETGSNRPEGLIPAARPLRRSKPMRTPLSSIIALAIVAPPPLKAATSARVICSMFRSPCARFGVRRIAFQDESIPIHRTRTKQELLSRRGMLHRTTGARLPFRLLANQMLSVLIETRNHEEELARTLASLVGGAVEGVVREVIICDAGSTDHTHMVAEHAGCRYVAEGGIGAAVRQAKGEWLVLLEP